MEAGPLIVGAGPTGLAAALFLAMKGVRSRIIDQTPEPAQQSRAQVVNPRSLELLESAGIADAMLAEAHTIHRTVFYEDWHKVAELDFSDAHPHYELTVLPQTRSEAILAQALAARGIRAERGVRLDTFSQGPAAVAAELVYPNGKHETAFAPILLGADGAHSRVREVFGIEFEGSAFPESWPLFDVQLDDPLDLESAHVSFVDGGLVFLLGIRRGLWRVFSDVPEPLQRLPDGAVPGEIAWQSDFHISHRLAHHETVGRVALAGDAAHVHSPVAARGMNLGIEDAYVFADCARDALAGRWDRLEDYGRLRHQVHRKVIWRIWALTKLARGQPEFMGMLRHYLIPAMTRFPPVCHAMLQLLTGLDHDVRTFQ
jgi:2-polyprenyl-6-methoxyphenol hydroxylase-like FAD-dependent oxidoreductase